MISTHCGKRLKNLFGEAVYEEDAKTKKRGPLRHVWICTVCRKRFEQRVRVSRMRRG